MYARGTAVLQLSSQLAKRYGNSLKRTSSKSVGRILVHVSVGSVMSASSALNPLFAAV